jgi:hypothetical protein
MLRKSVFINTDPFLNSESLQIKTGIKKGTKAETGKK